MGWYQDKNFSQEWNFEDDTVKAEMTLYARWGISPGKIMMTGGEFPSSVTDAFTKEICYRLPENTNCLNITLRYDASAVLYQSIEPKDFRYCFVSGPFEDPQNPGFMLLSIICKYNDTGSVSGELDVNPFNLNFKLLRSASYTQTVDFVQDSPDSLYAIGEDGVPLSFTYIENGIVWNTTDGYASYFTINGESVISSPTSYNTTLYPARPPKEPSVLWSVSDPSTATIDSNGLLTPLKDGSVILTAQTTDGSGFSAAKMITIGSEGPEPKINGILIGTMFSAFSPDIYDYRLNYYRYFDHSIISALVEFDDGLSVSTRGPVISQSGYLNIIDCDSPYASVNNGQRSVTYHFPYNYNSSSKDTSPPPLHLSMYMGEYAALYNVTSGWTSKNKDIATVDQSGVVHATGVGRAILTHPDGWECRVDIETSGLDYTLKNPRVENGSLMVALQNDTQRRAQDTLIAAFYDADGRLMHMNAQKLTSDMVGEISAGTVPADLPCSYSKIIVWEGTDAPTPLSNAAVLRELQTK